MKPFVFHATSLIAWMVSWALLWGASLAAQPDSTPSRETLAARLAAEGRFSEFLGLVEAAGLSSILSGDGNYTIFAPTDRAFDAAFDPALQNAISRGDRSLLRPIVLTYITTNPVDSQSFIQARSVLTMNGETLRLSATPNGLMVNNVRIESGAVSTDNGAAYVLGGLLHDPEVRAEGAGSARALAFRAIQLGAPIFNEGQVAACAAIYEVAIRGLLASTDPGLTSSQRARLNIALKQGLEAGVGSSDQAWIYRRAMDSILAESAP